MKVENYVQIYNKYMELFKNKSSKELRKTLSFANTIKIFDFERGLYIILNIDGINYKIYYNRKSFSIKTFWPDVSEPIFEISKDMESIYDFLLFVFSEQLQISDSQLKVIFENILDSTQNMRKIVLEYLISKLNNGEPREYATKFKYLENF